MNDPRRGRRTLLMLAAVFFGPVFVSMGLYYLTDWRPVGQTNHGELIAPARPILGAPSELTKEWSLVYIGDAAGCDEACRDALVLGRQTRLALNKEMTRVSRVMLATSGCCTSEYLAREQEGLVVLDASSGPNAALVDQFPPQDRAHSLYVVDPRGNLVMRYDAREEPKGFLTDLKKLLKLSHIG